MSLPPCLEWALRYAAKGRRVFPCHAWAEGKCTCGKDDCTNQAKHPVGRLVPHGRNDASCDPEVIRRWWTEAPFANVAIATGPESGLAVLDVDPRHGGEDSLVALREDAGELPRTFVVKTGGGGWHYYFKHPGTKVPSVGGKLGPGLDTRGDGGYVLAPPSNHLSGGSYLWSPDAPADMAVFPDFLLDLLKGPAAPAAPPPVPSTRPDRMVGPGNPYGLRGLELECDHVARAPEGTRNMALNRAAFSVGQLVAGGELDQGHAYESLLAAARSSGLGDGEAKRTISSGLAGGARYPRRGEYAAPPPRPPAAPLTEPSTAAAKASPASPPVATAEAPTPAPARSPLEEKERQNPKYTELGNCWRFAEQHGESLRYTDAHGWLVWDGRRWKPEESEEVQELAKRTAASLVRSLVRDDMSDDAKKAAFFWALKSQKASVIEATKRLARSETGIAAASRLFDSDPWALNCENGTVDLGTGELREHRKKDHLTKLCPCPYDPTARAARWEAFLERVLPDGEVREFVQRLAGYALTGSTREEKITILWGKGANGKSVFVETLGRVLGDYARATPFETFCVKRPGSASEDVAELAGARLVMSSEGQQGARLNEAMVKELTGRDTVSARHLYKRRFSFRPEFKVFLRSNHRPRITGTDNGIWRRILLIPFTVQIPDEEQDKDLERRLQGELPGILRWLVEGCLWWQKEGLREPKAVRAAVANYRAEEDLLAAFLDDCCVEDLDAEVPVGELRRVYERWCEGQGEEPVTSTLFGRMLTERNFEPDKVSGGGRVRRGLRLNSAWTPPLEPPPERGNGRDPSLWR